jgi:hypothetical protein
MTREDKKNVKKNSHVKKCLRRDFYVRIVNVLRRINVVNQETLTLQ